MRSRYDRLIRAVILGFVLVVVGPATQARAERIQSDLVLIRSEDVVPEDLYAAGNRVTISGTVEGDLVAVAFEEVRIEGVVTGSVMAAASRVVVTGRVGGSLRAAAPTVVVDGRVADDVFVAANRLQVGESARIGRDLLAWTRSAVVAGSVGRNIEGQDGRLVLRGQVAGDVEVTVDSLRVDGARVAGDLAYRSEDPAEVSEVDVGGSLLHRRPLPPNIELRALRLLVFVLGWIGAAALGLSMLWAVPDRARSAIDEVTNRPGHALARGLGVVAIPAAVSLGVAAAVAVTPASAGIPLLALFLPIVLGLVSLVGLGFTVATVPVATLVGRKVRAGLSDYGAFLTGMGLWALVFAVPVVGRWLTVAALVVGLGAWLAPPQEAAA